MIRAGSTATPEVVEKPSGPVSGFGGWTVIVFNNETNTYEEVMHILQVATQCSPEEAYMETWEIDHMGQSVVHVATKAECEKVAAVISTIGIKTAVSEA